MGAFATKEASSSPRLSIVGLGTQYPPYILDADWLESITQKFFDVTNPGLKKLLQINRHTGIQTRALVSTYESGFGTSPTAPSIADIDDEFRRVGVDLAVGACKKALKEWGGDLKHITHTIAVTCTNNGHPGYDVAINQVLNLPPNVDRMLLHGVGCAGGLAILRAAAQIADGAARRGRPARILAYACEICSLSYRFELEEACRANPADVNIGPALFSDAAAAFVLCNEYGLTVDDVPVFEVMDWGSATIPGTTEQLGFYAKPDGYKSIIAKDVPSYTSAAINPMFQQLLPSLRQQVGDPTFDIPKFDWAIHPGGGAILKAAQKTLQLSDEQIWASWDIYRTRGNSSSPTVLIILDRMRSAGKGRDHVVAAAFGPGLMIEMAALKRCRVAGKAVRRKREGIVKTIKRTFEKYSSGAPGEKKY